MLTVPSYRRPERLFQDNTLAYLARTYNHLNCDRKSIRFVILGHNRAVGLCTKTEMNKEKTQNVNVETQMWEKPRQPTDCRKSLWEEDTESWRSTEATTSCLLPSPHGGYNEATTSLSLSHALSVHSYTRYAHTTTNVQQQLYVCPKSYLYTYDFRAIYTYGPKGLTRTHLRMCPFQSVGRITTGS